MNGVAEIVDEFLVEEFDTSDQPTPHVGLALGGGGAKAAAHLGVLQLLIEEGIPIHSISGTSAGALIAVLFASGLSPIEIARLFEQENERRSRWPKFLDPGGWRRLKSVFQNGRLHDVLRYHTAGRALNELVVPVHVTATDLNRGEQVVFSDGDPVEATLASMCLPLLMEPIAKDESLLVDGAVMGAVPSWVLRERGADVVIGVDVSSSFRPVSRRSSLRGSVPMLKRLVRVQQRRLEHWDQRAVDVMIRPDTTGFGFTDIERTSDLMRVGRTAAFEALPELTQLLSEHARIRQLEVT